MKYKYPCPIVNDSDLDVYKELLHHTDCDEHNKEPVNCEVKIESRGYSGISVPHTLTDNAYLPCYLKKHIGKLVKIESIISCCLESRVGTLMEVGADYVVIKLYQSCSTMVCDAKSIRYITIVHDNDYNKAGLF